MKKMKRLFMVLVVCLICAGVYSMPASASAKVTKVKKIVNYSSGKEKITIKGYTSSGKVAWKYKCTTTEIAQCEHASYATNSKYVFVFDQNTFIRLSKQTGKVLTKKKKMPIRAAALAMYADASGNVYAVNYMQTTLYKLTKSGKKVWTCNLGSDHFWAYKIKKSGSNIKILFETASTRTVNMKTGKLVK